MVFCPLWLVKIIVLLSDHRPFRPDALTLGQHRIKKAANAYPSPCVRFAHGRSQLTRKASRRNHTSNTTSRHPSMASQAVTNNYIKALDSSRFLYRLPEACWQFGHPVSDSLCISDYSAASENIFACLTRLRLWLCNFVDLLVTHCIFLHEPPSSTSVLGLWALRCPFLLAAATDALRTTRS
ncbi:hypothetical protein B0H12DRAFT_215982 [Mycena haematopus]|nr:hypothetical protein B0H12DRAFT_215982 [Mycena haematopus]